MLFSNNPSTVAKYQQATDEKKVSMPNICRIPKREKCVDCGKHRTHATGVMKKRGFVCAMCK